MTDAKTAHDARNAAAKAARQQRIVGNYLAHVARNNQASEDAASLRATRRAMNAEIHGFRNDAVSGRAVKAKDIRVARHKETNRLLNENALDARAAKKACAAREAAGEPSIGTLIQMFSTEGAADILLSGAQHVLPLAA